MVALHFSIRALPSHCCPHSHRAAPYQQAERTSRGSAPWARSPATHALPPAPSAPLLPVSMRSALSTEGSSTTLTQSVSLGARVQYRGCASSQGGQQGGRLGQGGPACTFACGSTRACCYHHFSTQHIPGPSMSMTAWGQLRRGGPMHPPAVAQGALLSQAAHNPAEQRPLCRKAEARAGDSSVVGSGAWFGPDRLLALSCHPVLLQPPSLLRPSGHAPPPPLPAPRPPVHSTHPCLHHCPPAVTPWSHRGLCWCCYRPPRAPPPPPPPPGRWRARTGSAGCWWPMRGPAEGGMPCVQQGMVIRLRQ